MRPKRAIRIVLYVVIGLTALLIFDIVALMLFFSRPPDDMARSSGPNAVWAEHAWVGTTHDAAAYDALARDLERNGITDVFFHVGPLGADGKIDPALYPNAEALIAALDARMPDLRAQAWIGQKEMRAGGPLDLGDAAVRANIVATASEFLAMGFDGIHYNIEPIVDGDRRLLALLDETRPIVDRTNATLSVATDEIEPFPGARRFVERLVLGAGLWSQGYYAEIAGRVDQVAVMMYDTGIPLPWAYSAVVAWSTPRIWRSIGPDTILFIGVPTYDEDRPGFNAEAENMKSALTGIERAMPRNRGAPRHFGLAIYAQWTTDEKEWAYWRLHWLGVPD
jgi:hypothetical protein